MQRRTLFLIDGMSCAYRAFYAIRDLRSSSGEPTNAVYGFTNMLLKLLRERTPDAVAVVFDTPAPTFRHERFGAYKATRKPMPDDLSVQLPFIREVIDAYRIPSVQRDGVEADDLMASLAVRAVGEGYDVFLVTSDKDMLQLVGDRISVIRPEAGEVCDAAAVTARFGVEPAKVIEVLALAGDASDNVPGVPGIGEKTAIELVRQFGGIEGVLAHVAEVKGEKRREKLVRHAEQARLSRELVTLKRDVPLDIATSALAVKEPDRARLGELFRRFEFRRLQAEFAGGNGPGVAEYRCLEDPEALAQLAAALAKTGGFALELVATSRDPMAAELVGIAICSAPGAACYAPGTGRLRELLGPSLANPRLMKTGHDLKRAARLLRGAGLELEGQAFDTMLAAWLLNPSRASYELGDLALDYLDTRLAASSGLAGKKSASLAELPPAAISPHACAEADAVLRLRALMEPRLAEQGMDALFRDIEMPLAEVLGGMEETGIRVETEPLRRLSAELGGALEELESAIHRMAGGAFNLNSPSQLARVLFERLGLTPTRKIKTGWSTDYDALLDLSRLHPLPAKLLEYRSLSKLKNTYVDILPRLVNARTGRIHTTFRQTGTATGRLSSSDPNLQNIPVRTEIGRRIRQAFVPGRPGMVLLSADYSQIDLRVLAHLSGDRELVAAFARGDDIHARTAAALFGVEAAAVTPEMRRQAKTVNFGIVYGMSAFGLARDLGIAPGEARGFIDRYFQHYAGVRRYIDAALKEAAARGWVATLLNRRRAVPELASRSGPTREQGSRIATNAPIQGSSADLIKIAMLAIAREMRGGRWRAAMLIQIHDELLFEVDREQAVDFGAMVREKMEKAWALRVPLEVRLETGSNWGEL
ncbi:MAG TPA: DNA polymerase I [bacterium]|nr:DNA polymerase I [bacterium]